MKSVFFWLFVAVITLAGLFGRTANAETFKEMSYTMISDAEYYVDAADYWFDDFMDNEAWINQMRIDAYLDVIDGMDNWTRLDIVVTYDHLSASMALSNNATSEFESAKWWYDEYEKQGLDEYDPKWLSACHTKAYVAMQQAMAAVDGYSPEHWISAPRTPWNIGDWPAVEHSYNLMSLSTCWYKFDNWAYEWGYGDYGY
jgi:hypothetical protein